MTLLWAGGEDTSFASLMSPMGPSTAGSSFRSGFAREGIGTGNNVSPMPTTWPMSIAAVTPVWGPSSSFWVHGQYMNSNNNGTISNSIFLALADSSGVGRLLIRGTGTNGQLKISTRNAAGTITDLVTSAAGAYTASSLPLPFDLFVNYAVSGQATLYWNGAIIADTGAAVNVTTDSVTALAQAFFGIVQQPSTAAPYWSELAVRTSSTLGMGIKTLPPVASGATQSFLPNTVGNVNPTTINDANSVATTSVNTLSEWTVATSLPTGSWAIAAVVQEARVSVGLTGPQHFAWDQRVSNGGGTSYQSGSVAPLTSFSNFQTIVALNPNTGVAFLPGELINSGIKSLT